MMVAIGLELSVDTELAAVYAAGRENNGKYVVQEMFYGAALLAAAAGGRSWVTWWIRLPRASAADEHGQGNRTAG